MGEATAVTATVLTEVRSAGMATTMEATLAAIRASLNESRALLASSAQRLGVKEKEKEGQVATTASFATTPTRRSTVGSAVNGGHNHAMVAFPTSGAKHLAAMTWTEVGNTGLQGASGTGMHTRAGCSTDVLTSPPEGSTAGARAVNTELLRNTSFPRFNGDNPRLWREKCLEYFTKFNICKPLWTIAARMHMDGKAKEWFEAYRLRQVVSDWSAFIYDVEAHFGVGDLPPSTTILGTDQPSVAVPVSGDISLDRLTRCLPMSSKEVVATAAQPTEPTLVQLVESIKLQFAQLKSALNNEYEERKKKHLGAITQMAEPIADSQEEVLTHVSGVSLFLEPWVEVEPAEIVFSETTSIELVDEVFTCVGGMSLFWEIDLGSAEVRLGEMPSKDVVWGNELAHKVLTSVGGLSLFQELDMDSHMKLDGSVCKAEDATNLIWVQPPSQRIEVFGVTPPCKQNAFALGKSGIEGIHSVFDKVPPWGNNAFQPGNSTTKGDLLLLNQIPSWQRSAFSPWLGNTLQVIPRHQEGIYHSTSPTESRLVMARQRPWDPGDWCALQIFARKLQYMLDMGELQPWHDNIHEINGTRNLCDTVLTGILDMHSLEKLQLLDSSAMRSGLCQPVLLFKSVTDGVCLIFPWDPGAQIYVENAQLYTLAHELLCTVRHAGRGVWFSSNEIYVHPYALIRSELSRIFVCISVSTFLSGSSLLKIAFDTTTFKLGVSAVTCFPGDGLLERGITARV